jgi:hypothetical protein
MGRKVVVAITDGRLDFGPWEQIFYGEFDGRCRKLFPSTPPVHFDFSRILPYNVFTQQPRTFRTIQRFLSEGLIKDLTITVIPVILGRGKSLFGEVKHDIALKHISTKAYDFGFVQSTYKVEEQA